MPSGKDKNRFDLAAERLKFVVNEFLKKTPSFGHSTYEEVLPIKTFSKNPNEPADFLSNVLNKLNTPNFRALINVFGNLPQSLPSPSRT